MIKTFKEFIQDYNEYYQTNLLAIYTNTNELPEVMFDLYNTDDFEINYDEETIELF